MIINLTLGLGILFSVMGLGILINNKWFTKMYADFSKGVGLLYLSAFITLIFGIVVIAWNVPVDWKTWIVQVIGWLGILKGVFLFLMPSLAVKVTNFKSNRGMMIFCGIICLLLGLILLL